MTESKRIKLDEVKNPVIVTHSGTFHADDALAVSMLRKLPVFAEAELVRTRDMDKIANGTIVVDVGAEYDPARQRYDHHQRGFMETFDDEHTTKLSSAGLIWKHFGEHILAAHLNLGLDNGLVRLFFKKMYDDFVEAIDAIDNGISLYPEVAGPPRYRSRTDLSSRVGHMNPRWNEPFEESDLLVRFRRASQMAGSEFFERVDDMMLAWYPARQIVQEAIEARKSFEGADPQGRIVLFDRIVGWKSHMYELEAEMEISGDEQPLYVIYPDESGKWRVQAVPVSLESFTSRRALPEPWRGIRDEQLSELTEIPGCIFVHQSGFIGGNATKEGALKMARKALA
ncbi:hypothetical protein MVES1_000101 [Malassezia vespertilionis]|uniref:Metal-dependent protein hydrolase n=1 Tax=Malassezia vespertilionis TaxID=2020962 RepID=A0A2N1JG86_9BASI|nr:uncharacterized protein MVES1_000101 [Malassezia vespertilionis]PKI85545.1 hypothetical protein MVES_000101 [Malassezia vespertilionis]WFD04777.1 hypothetical protein MVES1_000101 [Malassezia vespertilionis]